MEHLTIENEHNPIEFTVNKGTLKPSPPVNSEMSFLENAARRLGIKNKDLSALMVSQIVSASFPHKPDNCNAINAVLSAVSEINPKDPIESMLAAQMVSCHTQIMRLMEKVSTKDLTADLVDKYLRLADRLTRTYARQVEVLSTYRRKGKQSMVVKHVTVKDGGQAIVGNVEGRGTGEG